MAMNHIMQWLKERRTWGSLLCVAAMAVIAFVYFYPDAMQGNELRQYDTLQGEAVGHETTVYKELTGETPRWTNSLFSGMPTFQISPSYESGRWFGWINKVMGLGLPYPADALAMMMIGFFILMLVMGVSLPVAFIGSVAYGFSTYFIILIGAGHMWKFYTLAYIPPTIAGIILCYRGKYLYGGALTALFAMMQLSRNHVQMTYYFLFVCLGFAVAYLVTAVKEHRWGKWIKATSVIALAGVLGGLANLPNLYNTYEYSKETMRGKHSLLTNAGDTSDASQGLDRDYITQYSYTPSETWTLLIPNVKGGASVKPEKGSSNVKSLYAMPQMQEMVRKGEIDSRLAWYLQYVTQYFGAPEGTNGPVYIGALIFALFLTGCFIVRGPVKWTLLILTLFSILLSWGRYFMAFTDFMIDYVPMYSKFRTVESILVIAEFTMPLLAVVALQKIFSTEDAWKRFGKPIIISFGFTLIVCLMGIVCPSIFGNAIPDFEQEGALGQLLAYPEFSSAVEQMRYSLVESDSLRSFVIVAIGAVVIFLYCKKQMGTKLALVLLAAVVVGDLYTVNRRYLDHDSFAKRSLFAGENFPLSQTDRLILADTAMNYRVMNLPQFWQPGPSYHHKTIGGYHAAKLTRYQDLIDRHLSHFIDGRGVDPADMQVLNMLNAKYIVTDSAVIANPEAFGNAWFVNNIHYVKGADSEMGALSTVDLSSSAVADREFEAVLGKPSSVMPSDTIYETGYAPDCLTYHYESANGGVAVFSEVYFPWGWSAEVDGEKVPVSRVNYLLRAVRVPKGSHNIVMRFDPQSSKVTDGVAKGAVSLIYLLLIVSLVVAFTGKKAE